MMTTESILLLSSLAESESVSISGNEKWSIRQRFQSGTYKMNPPYGYSWNGEQLEVNNEQAEIVKRIFAEFLSGKGVMHIARGLDSDKIAPARGKHWCQSSILRILKNENYTGNAVFQKTFTDESFHRCVNYGQLDKYLVNDHHEGIISKADFDSAAALIDRHAVEKNVTKGSHKYQLRYCFSGKIVYTVDYLSKKRIKNNGIMPQYYVENDHEAIIPKEIFMRVQDELVRRRLVKVSPNGRKHSFSSNHVFSQMIVCGECGELFRRVHWNNHGCRSIVWRCVSRLQPTGVICHARTVNEEVLKNVVVQAFNEMLGSRSTYQKRLRDNLARVLCGYEDEQALEIDKRLAKLQQELINHASRKEDYNDIADEIFRLREMKQKNFTDTAVRDEQVKRINELNEFIEQQDSELTEFDESLARRWLKEIVVWDDRVSVELKSGIIIEINI